MVGQIEILTRGGVYLGKLNPAKHDEIGKVRPVIILNSQLILDSMPPIIFICPLSSQSQKEFSNLHYELDQCEGKGHLPPLLLKLENLLSFSRTQVGNRLVIILNIFLMIDDSHDLSKAGLMRHLRLFSSSN